MKGKTSARIFIVMLLMLCVASNAFAIGGPGLVCDTQGNCSASGASVPTCPQITREAQRTILSNWSQTGSLDPSADNSVPVLGAQARLAFGNNNPYAGVNAGTASAPTCSTGNSGTSSCPYSSNGSSSCRTGNCASRGGIGSTSCPGGACASGTACANGTAGCKSGASCSNGASCAGSSGCKTTSGGSPSGNTGGYYTPGSQSSQEQEMILDINQARSSEGRSPLPVDPALSALARQKSQDMVDNRYFAHESPTYGKAAEMLTGAGYQYTSVGENIARAGSVEQANALLLSSTGHRRNIMGSQWTRMGVGVANDANGYPYVTELFVR